MTNNKKNTILIACDKNPHTSFGRMALDLQKVLSEKFGVHTAWLTTPNYFPNGGFGLPDGCRTIHAPSLGLGWALFRRPFRRLLKDIGPDHVLLMHQGMGYLIREIRRAVPGARASVIVHDVFPKTLYPRSIKHRLFYRYFIAPARGADGFIYNSRYTAEQAHAVLGLDPGCPVVGCPVDRSVFKPPAEEKAALRRKYGLDRYRGVCMNVGLDEPRKNIPTFFALAKARPETAFIRVGPFSPWMKKWLDGNRAGNIIHYSGIPTGQLLELYGCADLFIYPSFAEGFGMPPLEALACGVQAAAARSSALKENLDGAIPLIDPPDRVDGYLEVIDAVLAGKRVVDDEAVERLLERFSIDSFGKRARACFESGAENSFLVCN